jgi:hypothetical protein
MLENLDCPHLSSLEKPILEAFLYLGLTKQDVPPKFTYAPSPIKPTQGRRARATSASASARW